MTLRIVHHEGTKDTKGSIEWARHALPLQLRTTIRDNLPGMRKLSEDSPQRRRGRRV